VRWQRWPARFVLRVVLAALTTCRWIAGHVMYMCSHVPMSPLPHCQLPAATHCHTPGTPGTGGASCSSALSQGAAEKIKPENVHLRQLAKQSTYVPPF
jgi:hypothetical protein